MKAIGERRHYIDNSAALASAAVDWLRTPLLALDTEFIRTDTFHPRPALVQVSDGLDCWLLDAVQITDFSPLAEVMQASNTLKVLHAPGEDFEVFDRLCGCLPNPLFDTQVAAGFCGLGASIGYSRLVQALLDIPLDKEQARSDWLARPLTNEQLHYACLDVLHLPAIFHALNQQLTELHRHQWASEENQRHLSRYQEQRDVNYNLERVQHAWRLDTTQRQRLWHLLIGRDALARHHDKPRNHIARDHVLLELAKRPPTHLAALSNIDGLHPSSVRQWGKQLLQLANDVPHDLCTPDLLPPLDKQNTQRAKLLRAEAESVATALALPVEILVRRQEIENLVRHSQPGQPIQWPERFSGWREALLCDIFEQLITRWHTEDGST